MVLAGCGSLEHHAQKKRRRLARISSQMRLPVRLPITDAPRRAALQHAGAALFAAAAACTVAPRSARALVEGIPLYAPGDKILTPDAGFETYLPLLYRVRDSIPPLEAAVTDGDWAAVARGADAKASEAAIIANTASILGDEAYTALGLKAQFEAAAKALAKAATKQEAAAARGAHEGELRAANGARPYPDP